MVDSRGRDLRKSPSAAPAQGGTQNQERTAQLTKVHLYYEVPQNALCSLCLHHLNSGSKKKKKNPGGPLQASSVRCVRYRLHSSKNVPVQRVRHKPPRTHYRSSPFNAEIQKRREVKLIQVLFFIIIHIIFKFSST